MSAQIDQFIKKSKTWQKEIIALRAILKSTKLEENLKWNLPCYSYNGSNVAIIQPFKACLGMMFFKGVHLKDPKEVLVDNGPNSQAGRRFEFTSVSEIKKLTPTIKAYLKEAVAIEDAGLKVEFKKRPEPLPAELKEMFQELPDLEKAFKKLTPGRQRGYILHFSSAKQSETRRSRIEKCAPKIYKGKGLTDK